MSTAVATQGDPWYLPFTTFGAGILDSASEVGNVWAREKLRDELGINEMLAKQRLNDAKTNADVLALNAPAKGTNSDGSTVIEEVQFAGVTMQKSTLQIAGIGIGALVLGLLAYSAIK